MIWRRRISGAVRSASSTPSGARVISKDAWNWPTAHDHDPGRSPPPPPVRELLRGSQAADPHGRRRFHVRGSDVRLQEFTDMVARLVAHEVVYLSSVPEQYDGGKAPQLVAPRQAHVVIYLHLGQQEPPTVRRSQVLQRGRQGDAG